MIKIAYLVSALISNAWAGYYFTPEQMFPVARAPCDIVTCAEAYSVTRGMLHTYSGPLFQLNNGSTTLDIGQVNHKVDMSTWSAFCSGVASNCTISKVYAQIHTTSNDLTPTQFNAGAPGRSTFTIEAATGLPIWIANSPSRNTGQSYAINGQTDSPSVGVTASGTAESVVLVGQATQTSGDCCGSFGTAHVWNDAACPPCTTGTDFELEMTFGLGAAGCFTASTFCLGADLERAGGGADYSASIINYVAALTFVPTGSGTLTGYVNGANVFTDSPPCACAPFTANSGTRIHFGGGGDLSGPVVVHSREMLITNSTLSAAQVAAITANVQTFYPGITYPTAPNRPVTYASGPGDVVSGAKYFVGVRAYSAAEAAAGTQKVIHVVNTSVTRNCDILVAANGGLGNTANCSSGGDNGLTAQQFCGIYTGITGNGFNGGGNCIFDTLYDQTGNGFNFVSNTGPHMQLVLHCLGFSPCVVGVTGAGLDQTPVWTSVAQPYTTSLIAERNGGTTSTQVPFSHCASPCNSTSVLFQEGFSNAANQFFLNTGTGGTFPSFVATANDGLFHAIQGIFNAASSIAFIDGVSTSGALGSDAAGSSPTITIGFDWNGMNGCTNCQLSEIGFWPSGFTGTQQTNMNANQHAYWGF